MCSGTEIDNRHKNTQITNNEYLGNLHYNTKHKNSSEHMQLTTDDKHKNTDLEESSSYYTSLAINFTIYRVRNLHKLHTHTRTSIED